MFDSDLKQSIKEKYGEAASRVAAGTTSSSCCGTSACCGATTATWDPITANLYDDREKAGLPVPVIDAILDGASPPGMTEEDDAIYQYAMELNRFKSVSAKTYQRSLDLFGERAVVELTALVGYYTMVAMTLNSHEIPFPEGVIPPFRLPQQEDLQ